MCITNSKALLRKYLIGGILVLAMFVMTCFASIWRPDQLAIEPWFRKADTPPTYVEEYFRMAPSLREIVTKTGEGCTLMENLDVIVGLRLFSAECLSIHDLGNFGGWIIEKAVDGNGTTWLRIESSSLMDIFFIPIYFAAAICLPFYAVGIGWLVGRARRWLAERRPHQNL